MAEASEVAAKKEGKKNSAEPVGPKVVYVQDDVFVHTSTSAVSNYSANIIRGQISIIEQDNSCFVNWVPAATEAVFDDYDVHSDDTEWNIISPAKNDDGKPIRTPKQRAEEFMEKFTLKFNTSKLHSIRRSDSRFHWHFLVFILKDGVTIPALHFHSGGTREFIQHLSRYIWLTKSSSNPKLFVACSEHDHALRKSLDHLQLFGSDNTDIFSRVIGNAYVEGLGAFSKVTKLVREAWNQAPERPTKPPEAAKTDKPSDGAQDAENQLSSLDNEFENLLPDVQPELPEAPDVSLGNPVGMSKWMTFMNMEGKVGNVDNFKKLVHRGGIEAQLRKEIWKFLLDYYKYDQSYKDRIQMRKEKWNEYITMKQQWQSITPQQEKHFSVFRDRKHLVDKDVIRTDRKHPFYKEDPENPNMKKLYDILMTYCMYNFDLGYVQGMSDLLSPLLVIMEDEADTFWCFVGFMEIVADNFEMKQAAIHKQLDNLKTLIQYIYPRLYHHFEKNDSGNLYFCFRWLLILFKREFIFDDVMRLWESLWTQDLSPNFLLFISLTVLKMEENYIIENQCGFNEILKHINELSMKIDLDEVLVGAEKLCLQLRQVRNLPEEVEAILTGNPVNRQKPKGRQQQPGHFPGKPVPVQSGDSQPEKTGASHLDAGQKITHAADGELAVQKNVGPDDTDPENVRPAVDEELVVLLNNDKAVF